MASSSTTSFSTSPFHSQIDVSQSSKNVATDSETYDDDDDDDDEGYNASNEETEDISSAALSSPSPSKSSPLILYSPPTIWGLLRGAAINLVLPFINGLMLGFGELFAHEIAFRLGWSGTKIFPSYRANAHIVTPGVEAVEDPVERRRRNGKELDMYTALE